MHTTVANLRRGQWFFSHFSPLFLLQEELKMAHLNKNNWCEFKIARFPCTILDYFQSSFLTQKNRHLFTQSPIVGLRGNIQKSDRQFNFDQSWEHFL